MKVEALSDRFGARLVGLDLSRPLENAQMRNILLRLYEHRVVVFPNQSLAPERFVEFGRKFGRPQQHVLEHKRLPGHPDILLLTNIFKDGQPIGIFDGARFWHTDNSYEEEPASATLLYSIEAPESGGETHIADMAAAYDALSPDMKARIDDLVAVHSYISGGDDGELKDDGQRAKVSTVRHRLVLPHPVTRRKALYAVAGSIRSIVGMAQAEADELIAELRSHALRPEFSYLHKYAVGDVIVWDTFATLHTATDIQPATGPHDTRLLHRISVKGLPPILQGAEP